MAWEPPRRLIGAGPYVLGLQRAGAAWGEGFPWNVPTIARVEQLTLEAPITILAGDNGTGKSTYVELLAEAIGFPAEGGELERSGELPAKPHEILPLPRETLADPPVYTLRPVLTATKPRAGYFLRAESFFNVAAWVDRGTSDHEARFAPDPALYGGARLHEQSHGQSFLALAANRFGPRGLYVLDEPEAALSVTGCLALVAILHRAARLGSQIVIATHSPILLAIPGAAIWDLTDDGFARSAYDDVEAVRLTRAFLGDPARFVAAAIED